MRILSNEVTRVVIALTMLLAFKGLVDALPRGFGGTGIDQLASTLSNRGLNKEAREALTAGYYEGLLNEGSRVSSMNRFVLDTRRPTWEENKRPDRRQTNNFLYYELIPSDVKPDYEDGRFKYWLKTNSAGLADKEYPIEKPIGTRRIALMGDSITRGQGAPFGGNYESLLENKLNAAHTTEQTTQFEILNFAVGGYHITQQLEAAITKATPYNPDVYVVALSDLSVYRRWHGHISTLMYSGLDLKYDYLRSMVREARLTPDDPIGVFDTRLARFRIPTIQWVLTELQAHAVKHGAKLMVILVPTADDPAMLAEAFLGVREVIRDLGIPFVDLLNTFATVEDSDVYAVAKDDRHPNAAGHQLLFEQLYAVITSQPALMDVLVGAPATSARSTP
jgi:lysophospholipase L1-like esterase